MSSKQLMLGNEAFARGAYEAGAKLAVAYPGTPSTEITQAFSKFENVKAQWAPNEKVALETAFGSSLAGNRTLCCFKHVGLNVAADPLFTISYIGINAGLVIIVADDPGMYSSQNEQDSRYYAMSAHIPMLEPSDCNEAVLFVKLAFEISERYDTPVFIRTTTRMSHSRGSVEIHEPVAVESKEFARNISKNVMLPAFARKRHITVEARENKLSADADHLDVNEISWNDDRSLGIIASGIAYQYVKEALPDASVLKLGMVFPLPLQLIKRFSDGVQKLVVAEELEPFFEMQIKAAGIDCEGKSIFSRQGELSTQTIRKALSDGQETLQVHESFTDLPARPPVLCPGCPHRATFNVLSKLNLFVSGDIGCYTLGALAPYNALHTNVCMGASITVLSGMIKARPELKNQAVAVIGDSTFFHSGMTGLTDMVYNCIPGTVLVLDNRTTGMTGHQDHPGTGKTLQGELTYTVDIGEVAKAVGVKNVRCVDPFNLKELEAVLKEELNNDSPSVIICKHPCALLPKQRTLPVQVDPSACRKCKQCLRLGCPAIENHDGAPVINTSICSGCKLCQSVCAFGAIR